MKLFTCLGCVSYNASPLHDCNRTALNLGYNVTKIEMIEREGIKIEKMAMGESCLMLIT